MVVGYRHHSVDLVELRHCRSASHAIALHFPQCCLRKDLGEKPNQSARESFLAPSPVEAMRESPGRGCRWEMVTDFMSLRTTAVSVGRPSAGLDVQRAVDAARGPAEAACNTLARGQPPAPAAIATKSRAGLVEVLLVEEGVLLHRRVGKFLALEWR